MSFDYSVFVLNSGSVLKVGSTCFVDSHSSPFIVSRIFESSLGGSVFVSGVRCFCEGGKVVSVLRNFQVTVHCSFVRPVTVLRFVCQVCPVKSVTMYSVVKLVFVCLKKGILKMFSI